MKTRLKIVLTKKGLYLSGHIHMIAWSLDNDSIFFNYDNNVKKIIIDFPAHHPFKEYYPFEDFENSRSIIIDSPVRFGRFCAQLKDEANIAYSCFSNNCSDMVLLALKIAGINLNVKRGCSCKQTLGGCLCPIATNTPNDLFAAIKLFKQTQLSEHAPLLAVGRVDAIGTTTPEIKTLQAALDKSDCIAKSTCLCSACTAAAGLIVMPALGAFSILSFNASACGLFANCGAALVSAGITSNYSKVAEEKFDELNTAQRQRLQNP